MSNYPFQSTAYYEGCILVVYKDSLGYLTVGIGHRLEPDDNLKVGDIITQDQANAFYADDYLTAETAAEHLISNYNEQPEIVQMMVNDLCFNLGLGGFSKFVNTISDIEEMRYEDAASDLNSSRWASQVGRRATDIIDTFKQLGNP